MTRTLRLDYPEEVKMARRQLFEQIRQLLAEQTYEGAKQANQLHRDWLRRYPDDYIALDAGEVIAMTLDAYEVTETPAMAETVG